ncbi:hypothetical protein LTR56_013521 [Elasticomyces elasticus]|nr:hypothetical protein LTR56_013521 [Elasticomyces elasticus]KAK3649538.1 hypothetical protein LTR22_012895 [Elasticomyces elasticus]KAK4933060.1 hypothetical protein LTR49_000544 [Elasticomyces elasticus]KAK5763959.1 hypothetical protein LTS12_005869 [Elasticomyces elasticus]
MAKRGREAGSTSRKSKKGKTSHNTNDFVFKHAPTVGGLLFTIPAELRNDIYVYVLLDNGIVHVERDLKVPGLLQACSQIRKETLAMWYLCNKFRHCINHCDGELFERWMIHCITEISPQVDGRVKNSPTLKGKPDWSALMKWCSIVCQNSATSEFEIFAGYSRLKTVVTAALVTAKKCSEASVPWEV